MNVDEWLDVWGSLLQPARSLQSLPLWLQYFPKILFQVINKSGEDPTPTISLSTHIELEQIAKNFPLFSKEKSGSKISSFSSNSREDGCK